MAYTPPPFPVGLKPNSSVPSAKGLQKALKDAGYMSRLIPLAHNYGPATKAAVVKFHKKNPAFASGPNDPAIGPRGWAELHREAYGDGEPAHDYTRTTYGGKTVNMRTRRMLEKVGRLYLTQGSYNRGVSASAGTHDGGGVVDVSTSGMNLKAMQDLTLKLRRVGFVAWLRTPSQGFSYHIHAVAIGDRELSPAARAQIEQWKRDRNGLANQGPDPMADPYPAWTNKYR